MSAAIAIHRSQRFLRKDRVTVLVADRQAPILRGVCSFLESRGLRVVGRAHDGNTALQLIRERRPTVVVVDPNLPGVDGIEIAATVRRAYPGTAVIVYTDMRYRELLVDALEAGARGFVSKDAPLRDLVRAIEMVCDGRYSVNVRMLDLLSARRRPVRDDELTDREAEVLRLVVNGARGADVVKAAHVAPGEVPRQLTAAVAKLNDQRVLLRRDDE